MDAHAGPRWVPRAPPRARVGVGLGVDHGPGLRERRAGRVHDSVWADDVRTSGRTAPCTVDLRTRIAQLRHLSVVHPRPGARDVASSWRGAGVLGALRI